ncbi:major capsid protein [Sigmofec virus UA08Rod_6476]|uniref:Major capsid protein n=1 Tax=Sigmofec virus UA08Rod_6476 TaxID=2929231 RepID=A0A976R563_9VIRU|nr:major capsid protein [Sigmofec virus UA08Rod_6476]
MSQFSFATVPTISVPRHAFDMGHTVTTSLKVGKLTPIDVMEVIPGDTFKIKCKWLARLTSAYLAPVMDNAFLDTFHFWVPLRLLYTEYESVFGNPSLDAYEDNGLGSFPTFPGSITIPEKTVGDYLGLATKVALPRKLSLMKYRAFALVYDNYFRNENVTQPMRVQRGEYVASEAPNNNPWSPSNYTGQLPNITKLADYFTSCLPAPQKGKAVDVLASGQAPLTASVDLNGIPVDISSPAPGGSGLPGVNYFRPFIGGANGGNIPVPALFGPGATSGVPYNKLSSFSTSASLSSGSPAYLSLEASTTTTSPTPIDGYATISSFNVNDLRFAVQYQKMLEKDARGGSRYFSYLTAHYGVRVPFISIGVPEYLGGAHTPLALQQVAQTAPDFNEDTGAGVGTLAAFSQTTGHSRFTKGFYEHGYILTCAAVRYHHTYQQGIDRSWFRSKREDFYDPLFATLGEQPVFKAQLYAAGQSGVDIWDSAPFGYQEYGAEYRYMPSIVTGEARSNALNSFDVYHFADNYANAPSLNSQFIDETDTFFRRTTRIYDHSTVDDFIVQFYFSGYAYRAMPVRSIPSLLDHH